MFSVEKTTPQHPDFIRLILALDEDIAIRDGDEKDFHAQYNKTDNIKHALLVFDNKKAVGCGALRHYDSSTMKSSECMLARRAVEKALLPKSLLHLKIGHVRWVIPELFLKREKNTKKPLRFIPKTDMSAFPITDSMNRCSAAGVLVRNWVTPAGKAGMTSDRCTFVCP
jgi:putative acetyltransferase